MCTLAMVLTICKSGTHYSAAERGDCSLIYAGERSMKWKGLGVVPWDEVDGVFA